MALTGKRRVWRQLHLSVDTNTHEIIAAELSLSNVSDGEVLPNLLRQTRRRIIEISGDGAYDTRLCYEAVPLIPTREGVAFWEQGHPRNLVVGCQKLYDSNKLWKKKYSYHKRSLSEASMYRVKKLLGGKIKLKKLQCSSWRDTRHDKSIKSTDGARYACNDSVRLTISHIRRIFN